RKLAERLRLHDLKPVYHGETGIRMLRELARSYLTVVKDLSRVMNRLKALYRSWAIPCAGRDVYYTRHRSQWLEKIPEAGTRRRAEQLYQQLDLLRHLRQTSAARTAGGESQTCHHYQATEDSVAGTDSFRLSGGADSDPVSFSQQAPTVDLQRTGAGNPRQRGISLRPRASAAAQKTGHHSWLEQGLQP